MGMALITILYWVSGWSIMSIGYYIYKVYIDKDYSCSKKLHAWRAFWTGIWSWVGIFFIFTFLIVCGVELLNEWVEMSTISV